MNGELQIQKSQMLMFQSEDGKFHIDVRLEDETVWLTQAMIVQLFESSKANISEHIANIFASGELSPEATVRKFRTVQQEGVRMVERERDFYNLDVIISVGYRVNSRRATQFRQWATNVLKEYIRKGFALNDERMKNGGVDLRYFDELQARLREIRLSERVFYQKIKDIYTTSIDYDPKDGRTIEFFKVVQNKLLWAISRQTAAELVVRRANAELPFMGMQSYDKTLPQRITRQEAMTAKNYLNEEEMEALGLLVEQYLAFAEAQAQQHVPMTMDDWIKRLDMMLVFNGRELLHHAGTISHALAEETSAHQLELFRARLAKEEHEQSLRELERDLKQLAAPPPKHGA